MLNRSSTNFRYLLWSIICCIGIWMIVTALPAGSQETIDTLKQKQQHVDQQRSLVQKERDRVQKLETKAQGDLKGIRKTIQATSSQIQTSEAKLKSTTNALKKLERSLDGAEKVYRKRQSATISRLRFLQQQQGASGWAVLLESQNLNDFLDRRYQLKRVYQKDRNILTNLKTNADRLDNQRTQVEQTKNDIDLITQELHAQKSEYEQQATYQNQVVNRLRSDRRALEAAEAQLAKDSQGISELIQRRVAENQRRLAAERAKNGDVSVVLGTEQFVFPSDAPISSSFGWRMHPILGYQKFHSGMDFAADYGSTIRAADRGTVIFAGWYGGYGNAVIIDHGNGITTLYGHSSELYVAEGQSVERGQAIAAVGSTGLSTGPHLHFEVRKDGEPTDPAAYL
ncbi:MAG: peptidoglycan DD-metalloendopeptidase family protein [Myxacorys chilensis ATA2-1-KO14]|nr:peptidoglycan DD-metalloendopeptidase family protein [Myxacorys chilensis ATA2-1-KO14]